MKIYERQQRFNSKIIEYASKLFNKAGKANVNADIRKFTEYIFKDGGAPGKDVVYKKLGYKIGDSKALINLYKKQACT